MIWFTDIVAALAISQLAMLGLYFFINYRGSLARWLSLFCMCLGAYVLTTVSIVAANSLSSYILFRLATLAPFILWVISTLLFVDEARIPMRAWAAMAFLVIARGIGSALAISNPEVNASGVNFILAQLLPQLIMLAFTLHAIYLAYHGYATDLVEHRRKLRVIFVICAGLLITTILGLGIVNYFFSYSIPGAIYSIYVLLATLAFNLTSLKLNDEAIRLIPDKVVRPRTQDEPGEQPPQGLSPKFEQRIKQLMEEDKLYTQPGLTISELADAMSVQEYKLRRIINQTMRYRNFNQFLNSYRIEDASHRLLKSKIPISSIALDVGYSSLSVFNKAFKDRYGVTPSEYRSQHNGLSEQEGAPSPRPT